MLQTPGSRPAPASALLAFKPDETNPIHQLLDRYRLPWHEPRSVVEAREGRSADPLYGREAVFFPAAPRPPGFVEPWRADVFEQYSPDMPVVRFGGFVVLADDAETNIALAADHFAGHLGPASIRKNYQELACRWRSGCASLELRASPASWQPRERRDEAHSRDPRLTIACRLTLLTGFRLPLSRQEERWVTASRPIAKTRPFLSLGSGSLEDFAPPETEVEYARDPAGMPETVRDHVGAPPGREALILCTHQLFVVAARDVMGFDVIRTLPAKGGGGSTLQVRCRTVCPGVAYKTLRIADDPDPDGMTQLGQRLAGMFGIPCELGPYFLDA